MRTTLVIGFSLLAAMAASAVEGFDPLRVRWIPVASQGIELGLTGVAGGGVSDAAFSLDGRVLYARTGSGRIWQSLDLGESWQPHKEDGQTANPFADLPDYSIDMVSPSGDPEARVFVHPFRGSYLFALGRDLHRSPDGGKTWVNLTGDGLGSIIGPWQSAIAFSPLYPDVIVISNSAGIWKSSDVGLTWVSLNRNLPNFPSGRFLDTPTPGEALRIFTEGLGELEAPPLNGGAWQRALDGPSRQWLNELQGLPPQDRLRSSPVPLDTPRGLGVTYRVWMGGLPVSDDLTLCGQQTCEEPAAHYISALASDTDGGRYYLGTSDGRIWTSDDRGLTWRRASAGLPETATTVSALFVNPNEPRVAIAAFAAQSGGRIFRTTNGGVFWDDLTANLPAGGIFAVAAEPETGALYVAGDAGVFYTLSDLVNPSSPTPWRSVNGNLPEAQVSDLMLDSLTGQLYASVEGFGVYRARAPAVLDSLRVLNAADLSRRPASPGSLLTVLGGGLTTASVKGVSAPVLLSSGREAQIQVPFEADGERLALLLQTQTGTSRLTYPLAQVSPAIFVDRGNPLVLDAGTGILLDARHPAVAGSRILVLATGLGAVRPEWPTGVPAPFEDPPVTIHRVKAYLNGTPVRVFSSTLAGGYIGTYLVEVEVPAVVNSGTAELTLEIEGRVSNSVRIYTEP